MDAVLGATLGISSITAAAIGLFCSDSCGVLFGSTAEEVSVWHLVRMVSSATWRVKSDKFNCPTTTDVCVVVRLNSAGRRHVYIRYASEKPDQQVVDMSVCSLKRQRVNRNRHRPHVLLDQQSGSQQILATENSKNG